MWLGRSISEIDAARKRLFGSCGAQSLKNTDTSEHKGYDAGKEISGIRRHITVDTQDFFDAIGVTTAEITNRKGALEAFTHHKKSLSAVVNLLADGAYTADSLLQTALLKYLEKRLKLPSVMSFTLLK